jgi:integrase
MTPRVDVWEKSVGFLPHKVTVYEEPARKGVLYLRWRKGGNWARRSLRRPLRTPRGKIDLDTQRWALEQASAQYAALVAGAPAGDRVPMVPMTLAEGLAAVIDPKDGKYPTDTMHRREVVREMGRAIAQFGGATRWEDIKRSHLRQLWRARILQLRAAKEQGLRGAEVTVARVLAVASWLRDEECIPAVACIASRKWKQEMRADWVELTGERATPTPKQPRHTLDEMRRVIAAASSVDPRLELALALGAELRLGQVIRGRRPDLNLEKGEFTVYGKGHKKGVVVKLTPGQLRIVQHALTDGYLREMERSATDYALFPAGPLRGGRSMKDPHAVVSRHLTVGPIDRSVLDDWFHDAEDAAGVPRVKGRAAYGLRRAAVDFVKEAGISREGLQQVGGWSDTQMPDKIYADQEADYARNEARSARAKLRGEAAE